MSSDAQDQDKSEFLKKAQAVDKSIELWVRDHSGHDSMDRTLAVAFNRILKEERDTARADLAQAREVIAKVRALLALPTVDELDELRDKYEPDIDRARKAK